MKLSLFFILFYIVTLLVYPVIFVVSKARKVFGFKR